MREGEFALRLTNEKESERDRESVCVEEGGRGELCYSPLNG